MLETERKQQQELHRELMVMKADYDDLQKRMNEWQKKFIRLYKKSDETLNGKD